MDSNLDITTATSNQVSMVLMLAMAISSEEKRVAMTKNNR